MTDCIISPPDWSRLDFEVRKVIEKHDVLFCAERIVNEPIDDTLHPLVKLSIACSKAARVGECMRRFRQICMSSPVAKAESSQTITISAIKPGDVFSGEALKRLADKVISIN